MVKHDLRTFGFVIIGFALATWVFLIWFHHGFHLEKIGIGDLGQISSVVSINVLFWTLFIKYLWKLPIFRGWLIQVPDLSGEWKGEMKSSWRNEKGELIDPISTTVIISQSLFHINVRVETKEMKSNSSAASLDIDSDRGYKNLWYSYRSTPRAEVRGRSQIHYGSVVLSISDDNSTLDGHYWTDRQTIGDMNLQRVIK